MCILYIRSTGRYYEPVRMYMLMTPMDMVASFVTRQNMKMNYTVFLFHQQMAKVLKQEEVEQDLAPAMGVFLRDKEEVNVPARSSSSSSCFLRH